MLLDVLCLYHTSQLLYLALRGSLSREPILDHSDICGGAAYVDDDGIWEIGEEGGSTHAVGGSRGEGEDWVMYCLLCTV